VFRRPRQGTGIEPPSERRDSGRPHHAVLALRAGRGARAP